MGGRIISTHFVVRKTMKNKTHGIQTITPREADLIALALDTFINNFDISPHDMEILVSLFYQFDFIADPDGDVDDAVRLERQEKNLEYDFSPFFNRVLTSGDFAESSTCDNHGVEIKDNVLFVDFSRKRT